MNIRFIYYRISLFSLLLLTLILLLFQINLLNAYSIKHSENSFFTIVDARGKDFTYYKIEAYLNKIESLVSKTLGGDFNFRKCKVYLNDESEKLINCSQSNKGNWKIYFKKDYSEITDNKSISINLFNIMVTSLLNLPYTEKKLNSISWYISALNRKLYRTLKPKVYPENASFSVINFLLMQGYKFKPEMILNDLFKPDNKIEIYEFNSEANEILLNTVLTMKNGQKFLRLFLIKSYNNRVNDNLVNIFYSLLSKTAKLNKKKAEKYFDQELNLTAEKYSLSAFMPIAYYCIQDFFNKACSFDYIPKNEYNEEVEAQLEELPEVYSDVEPNSFAQIQQELAKKFINLQRIAPFFTQIPINAIINVLNNFDPTQKENNFKSNILKYKLNLENALRKEKEVYRFLKEKELKHVRVPVRYYYYFDVIDTENNFQKKIWPELDKYLTLEYKY